MAARRFALLVEDASGPRLEVGPGAQEPVQARFAEICTAPGKLLLAEIWDSERGLTRRTTFTPSFTAKKKPKASS